MPYLPLQMIDHIGIAMEGLKNNLLILRDVYQDDELVDRIADVPDSAGNAIELQNVALSPSCVHSDGLENEDNAGRWRLRFN